MESHPWLKNYPAQWKLDYPKISNYHYLKQKADLYPERTALVFNNEHITYRELIINIDRTAAALAAMGLKKGDRVALLSPLCPAYVYSYYATMRQGIVLVSFQPPVPAKVLSFIIRDTKTKLLIVADAMLQDVKEAMLEQDVDLVIIPFLGQEIDGGAKLFDDMLKQHEPDPPDVMIDPEEDLALIRYTSGTTGFPRGAMLTHYNLVSNAKMTEEMLREWIKGEGDKEILCICMAAFTLNACLTLPAGQILVPYIDLNMILEVIRQYKPALFPGVPDIYMALMYYPEADKYNLNSIKVCISADSPMPEEALEHFEEKTGCSILEAFGLAEASPITHINPFIGVRKPGSIGVPYPDTDCKIVDLDTGERELPAGEEGEMIVKGPQVMKGYWNLPNETVRTLRNGWLFTEDIARMDEDGYFYIVDRKKNMIDYAGNKIFPHEIEKVILEHPKVAEAVCIGIPEKHFGEIVKAFVVLKEEAGVTPEEIIDFCRTRLVKYKVPRQVEFRAELPKNMTGKILRQELIIEEQRRRLLAD